MTFPHIRAKRRVARIALAAGLVAALSAAGPSTLATAAGGIGSGGTGAAPAKSVGDNDKLGSADAELLAQAKADGDKNVTLMIATTPGRTEQAVDRLDAVKGASVGQTYDKLGYVRATVPTGRADAAISEATKLSTVKAIDLNQEIQIDDPAPSADTTKKAAADAGATVTYSGPSASTPAKNPYQPSFETGAVDFVEDNPKADGRGVTIGILDSGVDLGHPALQKTTTGERKIVDWVTSTDPITDSDNTWRPMLTPVSGGSFTAASRTWAAPEGSYYFNRFRESYTTGGDMAGDLNRDGDTTDIWGVLYDPAAGTVRVDLDDNGDFTDDEAMKPYKDGFQIGYFGTDDPDTQISERIPFVVQIKKDVKLDPYGGEYVGKTADFVNIGVIESEHGTHVAGITAANGLFGGAMNGAAPGAKIVSSRACTWSGGCTNVALTEGMIDLVVNRGVDIVNMSIGGLPALNDGNNACARLYTQLIDTYGVQLVISAGNSGSGANTIGDPGLADKVISVGAAVSKETWAANYGSVVEKKYDLFPFSSRGPREDGGFAPVISAPGASINTIPTWEPGAPVAEAGYSLPAGYGMLQGTSMASPQATGASALLLSAAKQKGIDLTPAKLRTALTSTARHIAGAQTYEEGSGLIDIVDAWKLIKKAGTAHEYTVKAPVDTALDQYLATPGYGTGLYDREGGLKAGQRRTYEVTITRTTGPAASVEHRLKLADNNDDTFDIVGSRTVWLPLNTPVTVKVSAKAPSSGLHSARLLVDDRATPGIDTQIMTTVVVAKAETKPDYAVMASGSVQRNETKSYFVTVPEGAKTLEVALGGLATGSQTRFIAITPYGVPADTTSTTFCYPNYTTTNGCRPDLRSYAAPIPGVWEIEVESRRTSPLLDNPYKLTATALGVTFAPETKTVDEATVGTAAPVDWTVTNNFAPISGGSLKGGALGSAATARPTIAEGETKATQVVVPEGATRLDVAIGSVSDTSADLDLYVLLNGKTVGLSADGDSDEAVSIANPAAGTYTIQVKGYAVPAGSTEYDYRDVFYSASLGSVNVDESTAVSLANGASTDIAADVLASAPAPEGRQFFGEVQVLNADGTTTGTGSVVISKVNAG